MMPCSHNILILHSDSQGCFLHCITANNRFGDIFIHTNSACSVEIGASLVRFFFLGQTVDNFRELHNFLSMLVLEWRPICVLALIGLPRLVKFWETAIHEVLISLLVSLAPGMILVNPFVGHSFVHELLLRLK